MLKRAGMALAVLILLLGAVYGLARARTCCDGVARAISWGQSDIGDQQRFPAREIAAAGSRSPLPEGPAPPELTEPVDGVPLDEYLAEHGTRAFLVLRNGRLIYERYFNGGSATTRETSFSVAKSLLATLVGIAIDRSEIDSVDDPVTEYVPELAERDQRFTRITIRHLLSMASGIRYVERGLPWSDDAITYYGADLREVALERPQIEEPPGRTWRYNNFHPLLLGLVLERATGTRITDYASRHLWTPLGAEADATWSLDSTASGFEKLESGFNARARDYARFGDLYLDRGGDIVSGDWVDRATEANRTASHYGWLWWVYPGGAYSARGKYGQVVAVVPDRDAVVVRLGSTDAGVNWAEQAIELARRLP